MVEVPEPGAAMEPGLNEAVTPAGRLLALRATAELNPPVTALVIGSVLVPPTHTPAGFGADSVKPYPT